MIFPQPIKEEYFEGKYTLSSYDGDKDLMHLWTRYRNGNDDLLLSLNPSFAEEAYVLTVSERGIAVEYGTESGKFRAITSLRQLFHDYGKTLPHSRIEDAPQFSRRGYMLDISRARIPTLETIKRKVDFLAELKYNELQLYMENFCYKFPHFPFVNEDYDCLTPEDMVELDRYCAERFIDLVPNQNCFGHMATWLQREEFAHLAVGDGTVKTGTLNILLDETFEFVQKLFDSVLPYFSSKYVNIGLDEAFGLGKFQLEEICREKGKAEVFMDWLNRISAWTKAKYGKTVMFWSDMVYEAKDSFYRIPKDAIALNWGYDLIETALMDRRSRYLKENGIPFYVCPGTSTWCGITGRFDLMTFNLRTSAEFGKNHGAKGYLLTDWGSGDEHIHYPVFSLVPIALGAQYAWNVGIEQNGYEMKHPFTRAAQRYVDEYVFDGARASHFHYKLQQTYLLEPERIHCSSMCGFMATRDIDQTVVPGFFDLKEQDPFYYENIVFYVNRILADLEKTDFKETEKRQTVLDARFMLLTAELCILRINGEATNEKIDELVLLIDWIMNEHKTLWLAENFENGLERSMSVLRSQRRALLEMKQV